MSASTKPRRVLYCESNTDGTIGGSHYCLLWLIEGLNRDLFDPLVVFYEDHALVPRFRQAADTLILPQRNPATWGAHGRGVAALPAVVLRRTVNFGKYMRRISSCVSFLRQHRIELVHLNNSIKRHHDWMFAAQIAGVPYIAHERGINHHFSLSDKFLGKRAAAVVPMSKAIRDFMVDAGVSPKNVHVLYDGLDPASVTPARTPERLRQEYAVQPDRPVIGIVGNIREWKGQETVVRALIEVVRSHPTVVCFFVGATTAGDQAYHSKLQALITEAGISGNVRFTGYQADPASFVNMMTVVIHASIAPEPFGMVVLEAMAQRKPMVGSRAGGVVEMVVDGATGYTFPPGDHAALAQRLIELLADPSRAAAMGQAGYSRLLDCFSSAQYMEGINSLYDAVLNRRSVPRDLGYSDATVPARRRCRTTGTP